MFGIAVRKICSRKRIIPAGGPGEKEFQRDEGAKVPDRINALSGARSIVLAAVALVRSTKNRIRSGRLLILANNNFNAMRKIRLRISGQILPETTPLRRKMGQLAEFCVFFAAAAGGAYFPFS